MVASKHAFCNILLLYPETPTDSYWSFSNSLGMIGKKAATPPLGLVTIAAMLPSEDFSLRLVDMNVRELQNADLEWADIVFVSAMIAQKDSLRAVLARAKEFGKTTVAGGPYTSTAYKEVDNVDTFFIGEAEGSWDAFAADLRSGCLKSAYAAPVRQREIDELTAYFGQTAHIVPSASYPDVNLAPLPRFDLLDIAKYASMTVQASRGCPVGCEFCDIWRRYGRKTRFKTAERILVEMDALYQQGWRDSVFLVDDNFIGNRARAKEVLSHLVDWQERHGWPFTFLTETTLSLADDTEMLDLMADARFSSVFVGIETPSEASLRETGKQINLSGSMAEKVAKIQSRGIQLMSGFIIGFDADPDDIAERMVNCVQELGIPQAMIGLLNALPDTDLYERLEAENRVIAQTTGNNTHSFTTNFIPARPQDVVVRDYKYVLDKAYPADMKAYFQRCDVLKKHWPAKPDPRPSNLPLGWKLRVFGNYMWTVLKSPYRFTALGFLARAALTKPTFMEQAIELGIKGHHHWVITRQAFEIDCMRSTLSSCVGDIAAYVQKSLESLEEIYGSTLPVPLRSNENTLDRVLAFLKELKETHLPATETIVMREKIDDAVRAISLYGKYVCSQVEEEYRQLSTSARAALADDMERFAVEIRRLSALAAPAS